MFHLFVESKLERINRATWVPELGLGASALKQLIRPSLEFIVEERGDKIERR